MTKESAMRELLAALGLVLLAGAGSAADLPEIRKRGSLRVLAMFDEKRPEFFSKSPDKPGFDREVLDGFAALQKLKLEVVPVASWDALLPALQQERGDLIAGRFTATEARQQVVAFTHEVFPTRNVVLTRRPRAAVRTIEALRTERVGTIRGTSMAEAIAAAGVPAYNVDDAIPAGGFDDALRSGRIGAAVWGIESAIAAQRDDPELELGMFLGPPRSLAYALRKDRPALLGALNEYVDNLRRTPTWGRLVIKYFGESAPEILKKARE
jgi:ABC-type amino acid transport substrate-binding protein